MRRGFACVLVVLFVACLAVAQQAAPRETANALPATPPAGAIAYYEGPGITAPQLLSINLSDAAAEPCEKRDGVVRLSAIVDSQGTPIDIFFLKALGSDLDRTALHIASLDRFKPGTRNGSPAAVVISDEISLQTCLVNVRDDAGTNIPVLQLRSVPDQKIALQPGPKGDMALSFIDAQEQITADEPAAAFKPGPGVKPPMVVHHVEPEFCDLASRNHIGGVCIVSLTVDIHGMPQDLRIEKSVEPSLDQNALRAISQDRFRPAMKDGIPFAARVSVEVVFHSSD